jgi:hypothetical protein
MANLMPRPEVSQYKNDNPMGRALPGVRTAHRTPANCRIIPSVFPRSLFGLGRQRASSSLWALVSAWHNLLLPVLSYH